MLGDLPMEKYVILGGKKLYGDVYISGCKNAVGAIIPATVLVKGSCIIENVPELRDVNGLLDILENIGAVITFLDKTTVKIDCTDIKSYVEDYDAVRKMRSSYYLIGALLGRFSATKVGLPGGCDFGVRPIDQHIKGFEALGAEVVIEHGVVNAHAEKLAGAQVYLDVRLSLIHI